MNQMLLIYKSDISKSDIANFKSFNIKSDVIQIIDLRVSIFAVLKAILLYYKSILELIFK